jgi:hypothetical protein
VKAFRTSAQGALVGLALALVVAGSAAAGLAPNPANHRKLIAKPMEGFRYDAAKKCKSRAQRGTKALARWLDRNVRGESWGILRCERWGRNSASLHAEGRALDWRLDARRPKEKRAAQRLIKTLLAADRKGRDAALARRMGVQGIIFNCKSWWSGQARMGKYSYCYRDNGRKKKNLDPTQAHRDHVHLELNWPGARKRTSFWRSKVSKR